MRWMVNESISGAAADILRQRGDQIVESTAIEPTLADDAPGFLKALQRAQADILTIDDAIHSAIYAAGFPFQRSIVYLQAAHGEMEQVDALERLFDRYKRLTPGRLYTVTASRVKVRQLPGHL